MEHACFRVRATQLKRSDEIKGVAGATSACKAALRMSGSTVLLLLDVAKIKLVHRHTHAP